MPSARHSVPQTDSLRQTKAKSFESARKAPIVDQRLGRGGKKHKYLQELLKSTGENLEMRASIEKSILDGSGSVDVELRSESVSIACEISITSDEKHELHNVHKCLSANYEHVIVICPNTKKLGQLKGKIIADLDDAVRHKVHFMSPEEAIEFISGIAIPEKEQTIGGYKVTVRYGKATTDERELRRRAVSGVILKALKRMKDSD